MKSKLVIITALVSIAIGLPAKADDTRFTHRAAIIGVLTSADCIVKNGGMTEEQVRGLIQVVLKKNPELNAAYSWALSSDKATKAVQIMVPYMNPECDDITISEEEAQRLIKLYLE